MSTDKELPSTAREPVGETRGRKSENVREHVYRELRQALMSGTYQPGQKIKIRSTAAALGVSLTPVHEALRRLASEGALSFEPNKSAVVPALDGKALRQLRKLRMMLEGYAIELAAGNADASLIDQLNQLQLGISAARDRGDFAAMLATNYQFHFTVYKRCENENLLRMIDALWLQSGPSQALLYSSWKKFPSQSDNHHVDIIDSLASKSADKARKALEKDIEDATTFIEQSMLLIKDIEEADRAGNFDA